MAPNFEALLGVLDMSLDEAVCPGLVAVSTLAHRRGDSATPPEEIVALERAERFGAGYVYFRRVPGRVPFPVAYVYDWTERLQDALRPASKRGKAAVEALRADLASLHSRVWSAGEVPLVYVFLPTTVEVYHVLQGPSVERDILAAAPWRSFSIGAEIAEGLEDHRRLRELSSRKLDDGTFWEDQAGPELRLEGAAFMALSQEIEDCRIELKKRGVEDPIAKRLLILFVMIKYLEERRDRDGRGIFPEGTFARFAGDRGATDFVGLLRFGGGAAVLAFLDHLADKKRFNGDVFRLEAAERAEIEGADLIPFADLLEARIEGGQRTFWRRYAFGDLPVELISHLYEQFLPKQAGVVYTPPFLVTFILDEVLPLSESTPDDFRLIDFACGSGVFLVGAFKRLVQRWRRDHGFQDPDVETLKGLLRKHVFGVDIEPDAIRLTLFSLCVALCDSLEPRVIWDHLHFDPLLETNLIARDFFELESRWLGDAGFDLIVGNPPFVSDLTHAGAGVLSEVRTGERDFELPDKQIALLFLKSAIRIARPGAEIALIQPSKPLLYNKGSDDFRRPFLEATHVSQIVDLTHLSRVLFKRPRKGAHGVEGRGSKNVADVPIAIIFAEKRDPDLDEPLLHVTVRRTPQAEQKVMLEIDHYDLHFIPRREAIKEPGIWKANFIGGGRIFPLMKRLAGLRTLEEFLATAETERHWYRGEGYTAGTRVNAERFEALEEQEKKGLLSSDEEKELKKLRKRHRRAPWLTGKLMLPTKAFTTKGIDIGARSRIEERVFTEPRNEKLFEGPLLLFKKVAEVSSGKMPIALLDEGICFLHRIYGIHAPRSDLPLLARVRDALVDERRVRFHFLARSSEYLVDKSSAVLSGDILTLPFPDSPQEAALSFVEDAIVDDTLEHVAELKRKGQAARVQARPTGAELRQFGEFFCHVLGSVYTDLRAGQPIALPGGICFPFHFGDAPRIPLDQTEASVIKLDKLLRASVGSSVRCQRILRVFEDNMLLLVKPAQLRYWLRSIAVRDADELFAELHAMGY